MIGTHLRTTLLHAILLNLFSFAAGAVGLYTLVDFLSCRRHQIPLNTGAERTKIIQRVPRSTDAQSLSDPAGDILHRRISLKHAFTVSGVGPIPTANVRCRVPDLQQRLTFMCQIVPNLAP
jgi:hypothetical protein